MASPQYDEEGIFTDMALGSTPPSPPAGVLQQPTHGLFVQFFIRPLEDKKATLEKGRPIYNDTEYVRIMVPGDKSSVVERPIRLGNQPLSDNVRFSLEYNLFKQAGENAMVGTPLAEWPLMSVSRVKELAFFNVRTVEQLAGMSDSAAQNFSGIAALRDQAKRYLSEAEEGAVMVQMQSELETRDNVIATMQMQLDEMKQELANIQRVPVNTDDTVEKPGKRRR